ncbi:MAG: hypothetical protein EOO05_12375, partial [Chitinophagaceae bacterium]
MQRLSVQAIPCRSITTSQAIRVIVPVILFQFLFVTRLLAQFNVSEIYTDYLGLWKSTSTTLNPVKPVNSNNLLAFTWNGRTFSTGVNDPLLSANLVPFEPKDFRAFPIDAVSTSGSPLVGYGQLYDGVNNGASVPPPFTAPATSQFLASLLTDGVKGLDIGSGIANVAAGSLRFNLSSLGIAASAIDDMVPDVIVTQVAAPSPTALDTIYFVDALGAVVGNKLSINHDGIPRVGIWKPDFYSLNGTLTAANTAADKDMRLWAADLTSFGINAGNVANAVALIYRLNGSSDPAFVAFNVPSISVATRLSITTPFSPTIAPACCGGTGNSVSTVSPAVQVQDGSGNNILQEGILVTANIFSGPAGYGVLSGTTTVTTDAQGRATFTNLGLPCEEGNYVIRFSSSNLDPANSATVTVASQSYYVKPGATSSLSSISSWAANLDGSGPAPADFGPGKNFVVNTGSATTNFTTGANWTVTGKLTIPAGKTLTISANTTTTLSCDINQVGRIESGVASTLVLNGSGAQRLDGISNLVNLTIHNPSGVNLYGATTVTGQARLTTGLLQVNGVNLSLNGTLVRTSGSINASALNSSVTFDGSSALTLVTGLFSSPVYDLNVNNAAGITLGTNLTVNNRVNMTNGLLKLGSNNLTTSSVAGGGSTSYIQTAAAGAVTVTVNAGAQVLVPVGRSAYNPVRITNNNAAADQFAVRVLDEVYRNSTDGTAMTEARIRRTWNIVKSGTNTGGIDFEFNWNAGENSGVSTPSLYDYAGGWIKQTAGTGSPLSSTSFRYQGYQGSSASFALFNNAITLPVVWESFTVKKVNSGVQLDWKTASELNSLNFEVQQSQDGINWRTITSIAAAGTINTASSYNYTDKNPFGGLSYYRIRQNDIDLRSSYSAVRTINIHAHEPAGLQVLGNPVTGKQLRVRLSKDLMVEMTSADGKQIWQKKLAAGEHV